MVGGRGLGPLTRCLAVADEARKRGHQVHFLIKETFVQLVQRFGYEWTLAAEPRMRDNTISCPDTWSDIAAYLGLTQTEFLNEALQIEKELTHKFRPDWVFIESNVSLPLTCIREGIPFASTYSWADAPALQLQTQKVTSGLAPNATAQHNLYLEKCGSTSILDLSELVTQFAKMVVIPSIPSLQPEVSSNSRFTFVGHLLFDALEYAALSAKGKEGFNNGLRVYAYLATSDLRESVWAKALEHVCAVPGVSVLTITKNHRSHVHNCVAQAWLPGGTVMSMADISLHAGTANTMMLAVQHKVPQIMLPLSDSERRYNSEQVVRCGAGLIIDQDCIEDPEQLRHLLLTTHKRESIRLAATRLQQEAQQCRGPQLVMDKIENI